MNHAQLMITADSPSHIPSPLSVTALPPTPPPSSILMSTLHILQYPQPLTQTRKSPASSKDEVITNKELNNWLSTSSESYTPVSRFFSDIIIRNQSRVNLRLWPTVESFYCGFYKTEETEERFIWILKLSIKQNWL